MHLVGDQLVPARRKEARGPAPAELEEHQERHYPVEGDPDGRVAVALGVTPGPGAEPLDHDADDRRASRPSQRPISASAAARYTPAPGAHMIRPASCWSSNGDRPQSCVVVKCGAPLLRVGSEHHDPTAKLAKSRVPTDTAELDAADGEAV